MLERHGVRLFPMPRRHDSCEQTTRGELCAGPVDLEC